VASQALRTWLSQADQVSIGTRTRVLEFLSRCAHSRRPLLLLLLLLLLHLYFDLSSGCWVVAAPAPFLQHILRTLCCNAHTHIVKWSGPEWH